jgi:CBS domain-containing protein
MLASAIMIPDPIVAAAGATSAEVAALMRSRNISVVPVIDGPKSRRYLGTVSDRDIVTQCVALGHDPTECSAQDHMRTDTPVVTLSQQLDAADHHIRATIVVIDNDRRVVGFIPHPEEIAGIVIG